MCPQRAADDRVSTIGSVTSEQSFYFRPFPVVVTRFGSLKPCPALKRAEPEVGAIPEEPPRSGWRRGGKGRVARKGARRATTSSAAVSISRAASSAPWFVLD